MTDFSGPVLPNLLHQYSTLLPDLTPCLKQLNSLSEQPADTSLKALQSIYEAVYPVLEKALWLEQTDRFNELLDIYQQLFREYESLLQQTGNVRQYHFILSIPIADRPGHLRTCLESIYQLCVRYAYGGNKNGQYHKIAVIVIEDSKDQQCIELDMALAREYTQKGLTVHHYGQQEQYLLMLKIPAELRKSVRSIIGTPSATDFYHKGQAVARNLGYLKALDITADKNNTLFFFVDSDQLFLTNMPTLDGDRNDSGLNYFYYINRIFNNNNIAMLTGKLVGDPPVSPSVMTVNFLDDMIAFFKQLAEKQAHSACSFHPVKKIKPADAAYHDMAQLFGFKNIQSSYDYCCYIKGAHDHTECLKTFAQRINYFFFGEHLTRKTYFSYQSPLTKLSPARTIYPGNYIVTFEGMKYIIPFGTLRLRMSGPTAGRLIQSEIGERFATSGLPMLHSRTLQSEFADEFRPGVDNTNDNIDITDEFERQFFGDLMLFTVARLAKNNLAIEDYNAQNLSETFAEIERELLELYANKHQNANRKAHKLSQLLNDPSHWWNKDKALEDSVQQVQQFIDNILHNFDTRTPAYQHIQSREHRQQRIRTMIDSLLSYRQDRNAWDQMLLEI